MAKDINELDLRIGNIIGNRDKKPFQVTKETIARFEQVENLLGKFKVIYMNNNWARKFQFDDLNDMAVNFMADSKYPIELTKEDLNSMKVFEAQNLYRFLTGKELKI